MSEGKTVRENMVELLDSTLPSGLDSDWPDDRPLTEAGLDSVAVLTLVGEIERRCAIRLRDADLAAENFTTLAGLVALVQRRRNG